jgi:hypothetical protein
VSLIKNPGGASVFDGHFDVSIGAPGTGARSSNGRERYGTPSASLTFFIAIQKFVDLSEERLSVFSSLYPFSVLSF